jgi:hypothetical protein
MPFDVFIFDERKVYILVPDGNDANSFTEGVAIESTEVAAMFGAAMLQLAENHPKAHATSAEN